jgi:hypothetical protein
MLKLIFVVIRMSLETPAVGGGVNCERAKGTKPSTAEQRLDSLPHGETDARLPTGA